MFPPSPLTTTERQKSNPIMHVIHFQSKPARGPPLAHPIPKILPFQVPLEVWCSCPAGSVKVAKNTRWVELSPSPAISHAKSQIHRRGPRTKRVGSAFFCDYTPIFVSQFPCLLSLLLAKVSEESLPSDCEASSISSDRIANAVGERHLLAPRPPAKLHHERPNHRTDLQR